MIFYPIVAYIEFLHSRNKDSNKKKLIYCGIFGIIGIAGFTVALITPTILLRVTKDAIKSAGFAITSFIPMLLLIKITVAAIASIFYVTGLYKLRNILLEKIFLGDRLFI
jgi:hypothetical protein